MKLSSSFSSSVDNGSFPRAGLGGSRYVSVGWRSSSLPWVLIPSFLGLQSRNHLEGCELCMSPSLPPPAPGQLHKWLPNLTFSEIGKEGIGGAKGLKPAERVLPIDLTGAMSAKYSKCLDHTC